MEIIKEDEAAVVFESGGKIRLIFPKVVGKLNNGLVAATIAMLLAKNQEGFLQLIRKNMPKVGEYYRKIREERDGQKSSGVEEKV